MADLGVLRHECRDALTPENLAQLVGAFLHRVKLGDGLPSQSQASQRTLMAGTLTGYVQAAEMWCQVNLSITPATRVVGGGLNAYLSELIAQRRLWQQPKDKYEPIPYPVFVVLAQRVQAMTAKNFSMVCDLEPAVYDWMRLGVFGGCRPGEWAQTSASRDTFATAPLSADAAGWAGTPLAFIRSDFSFYDAHGFVLQIDAAIAYPARAVYVHLRWRFDKSPRNFVIRKFRRTDHPILDPVDAAISILDRAQRLGVPMDEPIGVFRRTSGGRWTFIQSSTDVIPTIRAMVELAYPDPDHVHRKNIKRFVAHSLRVTGAVALHNAGWSKEDIAHRLRWTLEAVDHYLREVSVEVDSMTSQAVAGAVVV